MATTKKRCTKCGETKPLEDFAIHGLKTNGDVKRGSRCKPCSNADERKRVADRKAEGKGPDYAGLRNRREAAKLGITLEQYLTVTAADCDVCGAESGGAGQRNSAYVHRQTGKVTGTVCRMCAAALGYLAHDPERLKRALQLLDPKRSVAAD
ncbi:endonuclease domain-containing protein [Streptomyces sp. MNP-20]|uniref:endonuclease domain-containing protein n=1 Tax=Streptomyces sp. MNP-20 TaxID=2721165 RepID=UPI0015576B60|nr:endonuclease domain-containing protein [Streptomyces sp. MNP-20]